MPKSASKSVSSDPIQRALPAFVQDASRYAREAEQCLDTIARSGSATMTGEVSELFRLIHSLKGTASMLGSGSPEARAIATRLHELENKFATEAPAVLAEKSSDWLPSAREALAHVFEILAMLKKQVRIEEPTLDVAALRVDAGTLGFVARLGTGERVWLPLQVIVRVLGPGEVSSDRVQSFEGEWIPLHRPGAGRLGLVTLTPSGRVCLVIEEVESTSAWTQAEESGARAFDAANLPAA